jgi:hypothetical protein
MTILMDFDPSVDDEIKYSKIIAPYFLNALNKTSDGKTWKRFRKEGVTRCNREGPTGSSKGNRSLNA